MLLSMKSRARASVLLGSFFFSLTLTCTAHLGAQPAADREEWVSLFNGQDLEGWDIKIRGHDLNQNYLNTFRVEDGILKVSYDGYSRFEEAFGHLFYHQPFSYYRLRLEYRFVDRQAEGAPGWAFRNSGIMVHSQSAASMGRDQDFPISIEVQLLGGDGSRDRPTANLCTPGTHVEREGALVTQHCLESTSPTFHGDQWVSVEVEVLGGEKIRHRVNGETVCEYEKPQIGGAVVSGFDPAVKQDGRLLTEGYISLQSESHPVHFRNIELLDLTGCADPNASNYKSYVVKPDASRCRPK